jgi:glycosyltransferase involved in cell wall biosynthesis
MRILVLTSELPLPPLTGARLLLREVVTRLATRHDVTVVGYKWPDQQDVPVAADVRVQALRAPQVSKLERFARWSSRSPAPVQSAGLLKPMSAAISELLAADHFDIAHVTALPIAHIAPFLGDMPKVMVSIDAWNLNARSRTAESNTLMRPVREREERRIERFQRETFPAYQCVVTVTDDDAQELRRLRAHDTVVVIPNGVDSQKFKPNPSIRERDLIVFVGSMRWAPNVRAARFLCSEILPLVRARRPTAHVAVVGFGPSPEVKTELERYPGVIVTGEVEDVVPWFQRASVVASPMIDGTGIKNKVLEGLSCAAPSVATPLACQGLSVTSGKELLIGASAEELARCIAELMVDRDLGSRLGSAGRHYVHSHHQWDAVARQYETLYERVLTQELRSYRNTQNDLR